MEREEPGDSHPIMSGAGLGRFRPDEGGLGHPGQPT
jgi:hypothetical protein